MSVGKRQPPWSKPPGNCQASVPLLLHTPVQLGVGGSDEPLSVQSVIREPGLGVRLGRGKERAAFFVRDS